MQVRHREGSHLILRVQRATIQIIRVGPLETLELALLLFEVISVAVSSPLLHLLHFQRLLMFIHLLQ